MFLCMSGESRHVNPQTLLFSATMPHWVHETAQKYLRTDRKHLDLVCGDTVKTSKTVRVCNVLDFMVCTINDNTNSTNNDDKN